jgi:hypothetical protein
MNDTTNDRKKFSEAEKLIIKTIRALKTEKSIIAWSIGNSEQYTFADRQRPASFYDQEYFLRWLKQVIDKIKSIDSTRPVTIDINLSEHLNATLSMLRSRIPGVDAFGLLIGDDTTGISQLWNVGVPVFISEISPKALALVKDIRHLSVFIKEFQDQQTRDYITFNGVIDHWGRHKPGYDLVKSQWTGSKPAIGLPLVKILRPAKTVFGGSKLTYCALVNTGNGWRFPGDGEKMLRFEWHLVMIDESGEAMYMKPLGTGPYLSVEIPEKPEHFQLYVQVVDGNNVNGALSVLNLPLISQGTWR